MNGAVGQVSGFHCRFNALCQVQVIRVKQEAIGLLIRLIGQ